MRDSNSAPINDSNARALSPLRAHIKAFHEWIVWQGRTRLVVAGVGFIAAALFGYWLLRAPSPAVETVIPRMTTTSLLPTGAESISAAGEQVTSVAVHVVGAVKSPGVYTLQSPARVVDGVRAAGGALSSAHLEVVNLARIVRDGEQIYIPSWSHSSGGAGSRIIRPPGSGHVIGGAPTTTTSTANKSTQININRATAKQLEELPGVGPSTARAIVDYRSKNGPFASVDDLNNVSGIGPSKLEAMRKYVTVQ